VPFHPTPELVHGVEVSSPGLAKVLRDTGWFSGKRAGPGEGAAVVERDAHGFAIRASTGKTPNQ
jgi:hypothetical protein